MSFCWMVIKDGKEIGIVIKGWYDLCVGICVVLVGEVMMVCVFVDYLLWYRG